MEIVIQQRFKIIKKIGGGAFGIIYEGFDLLTQEKVSIKLVLSSIFFKQKIKEHMTVKFPQLLYEAKIMRLLQGSEGIPILYWAGQEGEYNVMVMELLGPSLEDLFNHCGKKFSLKTTLLLAKQMISRIEYFHSRQFIHRDIKPDNFLMGMGSKSDIVYLIDYGLAKRFIDPKSGQHIPFKESKALTGTARYTSLNNHLGYEQSRRDDLEGLTYVLIYLARGVLPWMGIGGSSKLDKYQAIMEMKQNLPFHLISKELPIEFEDLLRYSRALKFTDRPDYSFLRKMFDAVFYRANFIDFHFDWKLLHKPSILSMQKNLETQFLATEALTRRKKHNDKYNLKFPPINIDPNAIADQLKNGILKKEYNYDDPDNDDDFSRGGRKKYNDDDEYGEEDGDEDGEENQEDDKNSKRDSDEEIKQPDEDLSESEHDKIYPHKNSQNDAAKQVKNKTKSMRKSKLPKINTNKQQIQQDNQDDYDDEEAEDGEYDDEEDEDEVKSGLRSQQSLARDRIKKHLNGSNAISIVSNTAMQDLKQKINQKALNKKYSKNNPYADNNQSIHKKEPRSATHKSGKLQPINLNGGKRSQSRQLNGLNEVEEQRIKIKDLTNQINQGINQMNRSMLKQQQKQKSTNDMPIKRSVTPIRLQPIERNDRMLPDQPPLRPLNQNQPLLPIVPINLANNNPQPGNFQSKGKTGKSTYKSRATTNKGVTTTQGKDSLRLNELNTDYQGEDDEFDEEEEEEYEEEDEEEIDENQNKASGAQTQNNPQKQ